MKAKFGVDPAHIPDFLALVGDTADGYPGLEGIGKATAARLVTQYGAIEDFPESVLSGERRAHALLFKKLATLRTDAALFANVDELEWRAPDAGVSGNTRASRSGDERVARSGRERPTPGGLNCHRSKRLDRAMFGQRGLRSNQSQRTAITQRTAPLQGPAIAITTRRLFFRGVFAPRGATSAQRSFRRFNYRLRQPRQHRHLQAAVLPIQRHGQPLTWNRIPQACPRSNTHARAPADSCPTQFPAKRPIDKGLR